MVGSKGIFPLTWYPRITPHFAAPAILLYVYIYSIKATLQIIHPKSGYPYFYQILMVSIPVYSFLHKKNQLTVSWFLIVSSKLHTCWHFLEIHSSCDSWSSPHPISNSQLHVLPHFHLCPIYLVVFKGVYFFRMGYLILRGASRLDAFSVYPFRAWLLGRRLGSLTDAPAARPSRSSRTKDSSSQISYAHAG